VDLAVALGKQGVPQLLELLTEPSWVIRRSVVAGLAALGESAIDGLVDVLRNRRDDEARLAAAVDALAASNGPATDAALALAESDEPAVVCDAVQVLGRRRAASALRVLERLAAGADDNVAVAAIEALGRIGGSGALDSLAAAAGSGHFFRVFPAIDALGRTADPRAVSPLSALLEQPLYALEAARALARTGESTAVAPLSRLLSWKGTANVRTFALAFAELFESAARRHGTTRAVARALASLPVNPATARRMRESLVDADPPEQVALCVVLGAMGDEDSIALLTTLVQSPPPVGPAASKALESVGADADAEIARRLLEGDSSRRLAVLPLAGRSASSEAVARCLSDPEPAVRALACEVLARIGDTKRVDALFERLFDADAGVIQAATAAIQSLGGERTESNALSLAESGSPAARRAALRLLSYFGYPSAFDVFVRSMADTDPRVRDVAIQGLGLVDHEQAARQLIELAGNSSEKTRASAMKALSHRTAEPGTVDALLDGLRDPDAWVRYYACQSLGRSRRTEVAQRVAELLDDGAGQVRIAAIEALSVLGGELSNGLLIDAAEAADADVSSAALIGLGITQLESALPTLMKAARDGDATKRLIATAALSNFRSPEVLPLLLLAVADAAETVRTSAVGFISARPGAETTAALIELLGQSNPPEWVGAALSAPASGKVSAILSALPGADEALAGQLVSALARMGTAESAAALVDIMSLPAVSARKVAATTLGALGTARAMDTLRRSAMSDPDAEVRRIAALLLPG
jgi:HEAT repeat protein